MIDVVTEDGWFLVETKGSHHQFKHATKRGRVTIKHPCKDIPEGTARSVFKQAKLKFRRK